VVIGRAPRRCHRWRPGGDTSVHSRSADRLLASAGGCDLSRRRKGPGTGLPKVASPSRSENRETIALA
jgi:hypothetical protein